MNLVKWSRGAFGNTRDRLNAKQQELQQLVNANYGINVECINQTMREINELMHKEEVFWRKHSRAIWLPVGDKNIRFFHQRASYWRQKNHVEGLVDADGMWQTEKNKVVEIAMDYYRTLFTTSATNHMTEVMDKVDRVVTDDLRHTLMLPYTEEEVRVTLF